MGLFWDKVMAMRKAGRPINKPAAPVIETVEPVKVEVKKTEKPQKKKKTETAVSDNDSRSSEVVAVGDSSDQ